MEICANKLGLEVYAAYNHNLFKPGTIARFLNDLKEVLEEFVRNPAKRISDLEIGKRPKE